MSHKHTNALIEETSPYLLQHAHNPVDWNAWNEEVLKRAKAQNKLLLISIGYAACHWCHVMEEECFEDEEVAEVMNANFINIKIDREERPDVDQIYMDALQMMTGSGGWPLNIVALPDGRPFWGATYVKKQDWMRILSQLTDLYEKNPDKIIEHAQKLVEGIKAINLVENKIDAELVSLPEVDRAVSNWSQHFDTFLGGYKRAPKFMMPVNLNFLLHYATAKKDSDILEYVNTTLTKMAWGGIFDPIGGGFSRYSVDTKWHVPHFEKMLYDNGQLVSLYAKAYAETKNPLYKEVVERTIDFVTEELQDESCGFYSSLDADSLTEEGELEEGAYYVWQEDELKSLLNKDFAVFKDYFNINSYGHWEHGNYVLIRDAHDEKIAKKNKIGLDQLKETISRSLTLLKSEREKRQKPRLDDKILTSWNGLMLRGLIDAYRYLGDKKYLELALANANFIQEKLRRKDGGLFHNHKNGKSTINGFLEDYAAIIAAYIGLYEVSFDEKWLLAAKDLTDYCIENFFDEQSKLFFFTTKQKDKLIRRTIEIGDNVIPASNSIMGQNLLRLSKLFPKTPYEGMAVQMLKNVQQNFEKVAQSYAHWLQLALFLDQPFYEVAIVGKDFRKKAHELAQSYLPNTIFGATEKESTLAILADRAVEGKTLVYVCQHGSCKLPVTQTKEALAQLRY
ncbi:MAG: thioredoxin domain-containing protein [Aurantibacter sp.]